jgi:thiosulfate dehydrogenase [quinone] large subunit
MSVQDHAPTTGAKNETAEPRVVRHTLTVPAPARMTATGKGAAAAKAFAVLRIVMGLMFLWAFVDKTFGLNYSTSSSQAWINGGSRPRAS